MNRPELFTRLRPLKPDGRFTADDVVLIDAIADDLGLARISGPIRISAAGIELIKQAEGLVLKAYLDTGGVPTIGVGHTGPDVKMGMAITEAQADDLLRKDLETAEDAVRRLFPITTQNQFDALVSFTFNLGEDQVRTSTLRRLHNEGDYAGAKGQFARWRFDNGRELAGLVKRRRAEAELYGRAG